MIEIARRSLKSYRRALVIWMGALGALGLVTSLFWPAIRDASGLEDLMASLPAAMQAIVGSQDLLSPAGFVGSRLNTIIPLLITIYAAFRVTNETAGDEQVGGFEILLGTPVSRTSLLLARFLTVCVSIVALMAALGVGLVAGAAIVSMPIAYANVAAAVASQALLGIAFAGISLAVAGATGSRGLTLGVGAGLAVGLFFLYSFAPLVPALEGLRPLTLFDQAIGYEPLRNGLAVAQSLVLAGVAAVTAVVAVVTFRYRDLHGT